MTEVETTPVAFEVMAGPLDNLLAAQRAGNVALGAVLLHLTQKRTLVTITNVNMPFWAMVGLMIKISIASIPAAIILALLGFALTVSVTLLLSLLGVLSAGLLGSF